MFSSLWTLHPNARHPWVGRTGEATQPRVLAHVLTPRTRQSGKGPRSLQSSSGPEHLVISYLAPRVCGPSLCLPRSPRGAPHPLHRARDLPAEARERHCPVMGLYSWFSSAQTHRKDPSTFSQKASPHTPLSSSHSFTSGTGNTDQVRRVPPSDSA